MLAFVACAPAHPTMVGLHVAGAVASTIWGGVEAKKAHARALKEMRQQEERREELERLEREREEYEGSESCLR